MNHRLEQLIKSEGLTSAKFAEILSVQPSSISHLLSGRNKPNFDFIAKLLLMFPTLNPRWIINGHLPMYIEQICIPGSTELSLDYKVNTTDIIDSKPDNIENQIPQHQNIQSVNLVNQNSESTPVVKQSSNINVESQVDSSHTVEFIEKVTPSTTATSIQTIPSGSRSVQRVLLLYSDNSFDFFDNTTI